MSRDVTILPPDTPNLPDVPVRSPDISGAADDTELIRLWLSDQRSPHTVRLYDRVAYKLTRTLPHGLRGATVADIARFEAGLGHMKPNAKHTEMSAVRSLFSFAARTGYVGRSPAHVRKNRKPSHSSRHKRLQEDEVWRLIDHTVCNRDRILLSFLYGTGLRISEQCALLWSDILIVDKQMVAHVLGKGGLPRFVKIPAWVGLVRPDEARSEDAIFTVAKPGSEHPWRPMSDKNVRRIMREAALAAGIRKPVSPHYFRHSAGSNAEENGVSIVDVQKWLGHLNLTTTSGYLHGKEHSAPGDALKRKDRES